STAAGIPQRFWAYAIWLGKTVTPLIPLGWLVTVGSREVTLRHRLILLVWFGAFLLFYSYYSWGPPVSWWDLRFLLPGLPAAFVGALLAWKSLISGRRARGWPAWVRSALAVSLIALALSVAVRSVIQQRVFWNDLDQSRYPKASFLAKEALPTNALVVSMALSGALRFYTD